MKEKELQREQLRKELLAQDPSLAGEKEKYIGLLSRMDQHIPEMEQDPMFFGNLKNKLRYHLIGKYAPVPQPNVWQKFLLYGFPSLAIGLALIYILPLNPLQPTPTLSESASFSELTSGQDTQRENNTEDIIREDKAIQDKKMLPSPQNLEESTESNNQSSPELRTANSMIVQDIDQESATLTYEDSPLMLQKNTSEQIRTQGNSKITYNLSYDEQGDLIVSGNLWIEGCKSSFILQDLISLSRGPHLWGISIVSYDDKDIEKQYLTLTIENNTITAVEGIENICK